MTSPDKKKQPATGFGTFVKTYHDFAPYLGLGLQLAITIVIFFFLGKWLDTKFNTSPWLMVTGAFLGAGAGLYNFLKTVLELGKKQKEENEGKELKL